MPMATGSSTNPKVVRDRKIVEKIVAGDESAWKTFVEQHTGWVLYKSKEWCKGHCRISAGDYFCGLTSLWMQTEGNKPPSDLPECDEGMDTYIWIFEQLQRRVAKYTGKNDCLLSTYVWTILNAREFYIDWLRWKYGRAF